MFAIAIAKFIVPTNTKIMIFDSIASRPKQLTGKKSKSHPLKEKIMSLIEFAQVLYDSDLGT